LRKKISGQVFPEADEGFQFYADALEEAQVAGGGAAAFGGGTLGVVGVEVVAVVQEGVEEGGIGGGLAAEELLEGGEAGEFGCGEGFEGLGLGRCPRLWRYRGDG
jgi:hypothetical protein